MNQSSDAGSVSELLSIMARLRDPERGCPWDVEQTFSSIAPYTIEEAYEVAEAIARNDMGDLTDELGDLLLQVVFHSQMAAEQGDFEFSDVVAAICEKMVRRHPHVFGDEERLDAAAQTEEWEAIKAEERLVKGAAEWTSTLDGAKRSLPPTKRAESLGQRAAKVGFDWDGPAGVIDKVAEEVGELRKAMVDNDAEACRAELGDLLFSCVNMARHLNCDVDQALSEANAKFERRFRQMESLAVVDGGLQAIGVQGREALWATVKGEVDA
jgi:nucleoside triphosphate diphosphatase